MIKSMMAIIAASKRNPLPLYSNLISAYNFDSDANDQKGTHNGTLVGPPSSASGVIGNAYSFMVSEYITMGNVLDFDGTTPFSFSIWFNTSYAGTDPQCLLSKAVNGSPYTGYSVFLNGNGGDIGKISFGMNHEYPDAIAIQTTGTFNDGTWHHAVFTYDGSMLRTGLKFYADGTLQTTTDLFNTSIGGSISNSIDFQVGARDGGYTFEGEVDILKVWSRALTLADVLEDYNSGTGIQF
jgi:hypothetical protein